MKIDSRLLTSLSLPPTQPLSLTLENQDVSMTDFPQTRVLWPWTLSLTLFWWISYFKASTWDPVLRLGSRSVCLALLPSTNSTSGMLSPGLAMMLGSTETRTEQIFLSASQQALAVSDLSFQKKKKITKHYNSAFLFVEGVNTALLRNHENTVNSASATPSWCSLGPAQGFEDELRSEETTHINFCTYAPRTNVAAPFM